jgi:EAL domain-containing protein (putative c-di-GMP-specific phosphodiesterase class I)
VDFLKIDGAFVKDMLNDRVSLGMIAAVQHVAGCVGASAIAESVDSEAMRDRLIESGVQWVQGRVAGQALQLASLGLDTAGNSAGSQAA